MNILKLKKEKNSQNDVKSLQRKMRDAHFNPGEIDGINGPINHSRRN